MKRAEIITAKNGYSVVISTQSERTNFGTEDFGNVMAKIGEQMTKSMEKDSLISELQKNNQEENEIQDGLYIFKTFEELSAFLKIAIS